MRVLSALSDQEEAILSVVGSVTGSMEQKHDRLMELGMFAKYRAVFEGYLHLLSDPKVGAEALKRSLFLSWYDLAEPACFTGVFELPSAGRHVVLKALNSAFAHGTIDDEIRWMVPYYYQIADVAFPNLNDFPELTRFLQTADSASYLMVGLELPQFEGRGQLGHYWRSILTSHAYHPQS